MKVINARNVNEAYAVGLNWLSQHGKLEGTRNGGALVASCPVVTLYTKPTERVLFNAKRNANPFFHLMEGLWMLAGRNDVEWISQFNSTFGQFSDDGKIFHGAYGHRWRHHFGMDQLQRLVDELTKNPDSRRAVLQMWDPTDDLNKAGKDFPCNTAIYFRANNGSLDMTVTNRSNDAIWGAYGANAVHMSMLLEYMAARLKLKVGIYYQFSNNFHAYKDIFATVGVPDPHPLDPYDRGEVCPYPMVRDAGAWDVDLANFIMNPTDPTLYSNTFFQEVAVPMATAWGYQKEGEFGHALTVLDRMAMCDWRVAGSLWIKRKAEKQRDKLARNKQSKRRVSDDS